MKLRRFLTHTAVLAIFAVSPADVSLGRPPPTQPVTPGIAASQAL